MEVFQLSIREKLVGICDSLGLVLKDFFFHLGVCTMFKKVLLQKYSLFFIEIFFMSIFSAIMLVMISS